MLRQEEDEKKIKSLSMVTRRLALRFIDVTTTNYTTGDLCVPRTRELYTHQVGLILHNIHILCLVQSFPIVFFLNFLTSYRIIIKIINV